MVTENIKVLMEDSGCEESEAKLALELANDNLEQAIVNIGVMLKYITAYKVKLNLKNENIFGLVHIIANTKNIDLLRFSSVMTYNPVIYEQSVSMDWFSFEKTIYSYRLSSGVTEKDTKTMETAFRDFVSSNLKQHKILTVNDLKNVFEEFFVDKEIQTEAVAEEMTLREFKKLPNYLPDTHLETPAFQDMVAIELEVIILEDNAGKKVENIAPGDMVLAKIIDTRDISHYLGHLIGAIKENVMIPFTVPVKNIVEKDDHYEIYLEYADLITGISKVNKGRTLKVLATKRLPWWKGLTSIFSQHSV